MKPSSRPPSLLRSISNIPDQSRCCCCCCCRRRHHHHALRHPSSTAQGPLSLILLWTLLPSKALARPQPQPQPQDQNAPPSSDGQSGGSSSSSSSGSSYSGNSSLLNLYFLFIAIAILLLLVALYLLHRRKKRRKALLRDSSNHALAQDIHGNQYAAAAAAANPNAVPLERSPWRWLNSAAGRSPVARHEEGFNEHGEAPPPYGAPQGTITPPATAAAPPAGAPGLHPAAGYWAPAPPPPPGVVLGAIPMRPLSRDSQGRKPPEYEEAGGREGAQSANSSTGNLMRGQQPPQQPRYS
ncbi:hypothetical protein BKA81DRAFT_156983 [Phyllosticta paracitricarpa]|uniref:Uncharacterized protein n=1 Tax=Phyllosticta paracitricarpa TaxID=2016321 RepID=A0ABR1NEF1_9PEZI